MTRLTACALLFSVFSCFGLGGHCPDLNSEMDCFVELSSLLFHHRTAPASCYRSPLESYRIFVDTRAYAASF
jgi:hypothetical protein